MPQKDKAVALMDELQLEIEALKSKISSDYIKSIDVDEGWYRLVVDCHKELTAINPDYIVLQIKQKFGGLRYYFTTNNSDELPKMNEVVRKYEKVASITCEATGLSGLLMKSPTGWYKTLNPEYATSSAHFCKYTKAKNASSI